MSKLNNNNHYDILSVIRQKGKSQNGCFKKNKARQIFQKYEPFLPPDKHNYVCVSEVRNVIP